MKKSSKVETRKNENQTYFEIRRTKGISKKFIGNLKAWKTAKMVRPEMSELLKMEKWKTLIKDRMPRPRDESPQKFREFSIRKLKR